MEVDLMATDIEGSIHTKIYTTPDGRVTIEQAESSVVTLSADQILAVIHQLHACYDYCAAWKEPTQDTEA
jgi:hypothetical protein